MTTLYLINATLTHHTTDKNGIGWKNVKQIPTFFLHPDIQGIMTPKHAEQVAREIILPIQLQFESAEISMDVQELPL